MSLTDERLGEINERAMTVRSRHCTEGGDTAAYHLARDDVPELMKEIDRLQDERDGDTNDQIMNAWRITRRLVQDVMVVHTEVGRDLANLGEAMPLYETLTSIRHALGNSLRRVDESFKTHNVEMPPSQAVVSEAVAHAVTVGTQLAEIEMRVAADKAVLEAADRLAELTNHWPHIDDDTEEQGYNDWNTALEALQEAVKERNEVIAGRWTQEEIDGAKARAKAGGNG